MRRVTPGTCVTLCVMASSRQHSNEQSGSNETRSTVLLESPNDLRVSLLSNPETETFWRVIVYGREIQNNYFTASDDSLRELRDHITHLLGE